MSSLSVSPAATDLAAEVDSFRRHGFAISRGLFSTEEVEEIRALFERIHTEGVPGHYDRAVVRDGVADASDPLAQYPRVMMPHRYSPRAQHYLAYPAIAERMRLLFGTEPAAAQSMFYFKPPGARGQALHQDQFYLLVEPGTCIAAWTAIDDCDAENGAMLIVPETQDADVICPQAADSRVSYTTHFVPVPKGHKAVLMPMKAGDTLFFNGSLIHGSGPNRSTHRFRRSFIGHYVPADTKKIASFFCPLVSMDGRTIEVEAQESGGPCGEGWKGGAH